MKLGKEKLVKLYVDVPNAYREIKVDDFIVTIGKKGHTNSVYHIAECRKKGRRKNGVWVMRYYVKCYRSDLITCCYRDKKTQNVIDIVWYVRKKKSN